MKKYLLILILLIAWFIPLDSQSNEITLKEYTDLQLKNLQEQIELNFQIVSERFKANEREIALSGAANDKRLDLLNEFRKQSETWVAGFATKESVELLKEKTTSDIQSLNMWKAQVEGKASQKSVNVSIFISVMSSIIAMYAIIKRNKKGD